MIVLISIAVITLALWIKYKKEKKDDGIYLQIAVREKLDTVFLAPVPVLGEVICSRDDPIVRSMRRVTSVGLCVVWNVQLQLLAEGAMGQVNMNLPPVLRAPPQLTEKLGAGTPEGLEVRVRLSRYSGEMAFPLIRHSTREEGSVGHIDHLVSWSVLPPPMSLPVLCSADGGGASIGELSPPVDNQWQGGGRQRTGTGT